MTDKALHRSPARFIYLIGPECGPIKVGIASHPETRLRGITTSHHQKLKVHGAWAHETPRRVEAETHLILKERRLNGEWFGVGPLEAEAAVLKAIFHVDHPIATIAVDEPEPLDQSIIEAEQEDLRYFTQLELPDFPSDLGTRPPKLYAIPIPPDPSDEFRMGYVRRVKGLSVARQADWMKASGVNSIDIWHEGIGIDTFAGALRDFRSGDRLFVFSRDVLGYDVQMAINAAREHKTIVQIGAECVSFR